MDRRDKSGIRPNARFRGIPTPRRMVAGSNFARKYVVEGAVISYSNWRASRCARPRMTAASEAESRAVPRLLLRPLIIENRLLRSGSRAHPYTTRFLSRMNSGEHCSSERFILLLTSGSLDLLTGSVSIKGYRSRHEPFPPVCAALCRSSRLNGGSFAATPLQPQVYVANANSSEGQESLPSHQADQRCAAKTCDISPCTDASAIRPQPPVGDSSK
jgi:hypothetical protein